MRQFLYENSLDSDSLDTNIPPIPTSPESISIEEDKFTLKKGYLAFKKVLSTNFDSLFPPTFSDIQEREYTLHPSTCQSSSGSKEYIPHLFTCQSSASNYYSHPNYSLFDNVINDESKNEIHDSNNEILEINDEYVPHLSTCQSRASNSYSHPDDSLFDKVINDESKNEIHDSNNEILEINDDSHQSSDEIYNPLNHSKEYMSVFYRLLGLSEYGFDEGSLIKNVLFDMGLGTVILRNLMKLVFELFPLLCADSLWQITFSMFKNSKEKWKDVNWIRRAMNCDYSLPFCPKYSGYMHSNLHIILSIVYFFSGCYCAVLPFLLFILLGYNYKAMGYFGVSLLSFSLCIPLFLVFLLCQAILAPIDSLRKIWNCCFYKDYEVSLSKRLCYSTISCLLSLLSLILSMITFIGLTLFLPDIGESIFETLPSKLPANLVGGYQELIHSSYSSELEVGATLLLLSYVLPCIGEFPDKASQIVKKIEHREGGFCRMFSNKNQNHTLTELMLDSDYQPMNK